jgi:hypothetical protein
MQTLCSTTQVLRCDIIPAIRRSLTSGLTLLGKGKGYVIGLSFALLVAPSFAQEKAKSQTSVPPDAPPVNTQLPVNWLYGAYIPKGAPIVPLNGQERFRLYVRQTYTTPGIYIKTGFFALHDQ